MNKRQAKKKQTERMYRQFEPVIHQNEVRKMLRPKPNRPTDARQLRFRITRKRALRMAIIGWYVQSGQARLRK